VGITRTRAQTHESGVLPYPLWVFFAGTIGSGSNCHPYQKAHPQFIFSTLFYLHRTQLLFCFFINIYAFSNFLNIYSFGPRLNCILCRFLRIPIPVLKHTSNNSANWIGVKDTTYMSVKLETWSNHYTCITKKGTSKREVNLESVLEHES